MRYLLSHYKILSVILLLPAITAWGQTKPQIQNAWKRAPVDIKTDGMLTEWSDKNLEAYNLANRIYYAVSNDDENLYLTVRGADATAGFKILKEGVTFTISKTLEKGKKGIDPRNVTIVYPTTQNAASVSSTMVPVFKVAGLIKDMLKNQKEIDSLTILSNAKVERMAKEIRVTGIKDIQDTILSVYNDKGIKVMLRFNKASPIVEMALPLKYLDLNVNEPHKFAYNIKLAVPRSSGDFNIADLQKNGDESNGVSPDLLYRITETGLWGEYILIKK